MSLSDYLASIRQAIERLDIYGFADSIESHNELRAGKQLIFKAEVNLVDGSKLIVREYIDAKYGIEKLTYAYHYQDKDGNLIFRYDNASHKPALNFKEHKHVSDDGIIAAPAPDVSEVIEEIIQRL